MEKRGELKARLLPGHFMQVQEMPNFCGYWVEECWEYNHLNCDNWRALKKKAQLKNFQKSKGSQNSKQATHVPSCFTAAAAIKEKAAQVLTGATFQVPKESTHLCLSSVPNKIQLSAPFPILMCRPSMFCVLSWSMWCLYHLLLSGWDPRSKTLLRAALSLSYTICVLLPCLSA